ncbi:hypothetical protein ATANTOWER_023323 [Ataeniobius toweri]|uniref:Secreted protein n=1 Tax=Ataeniobius toweri TaxID=208326 RepID=A0ABU7AT04_9TELE|nr:hypothetical protein [Ataeniobius toweri]
MYITCIAYIHTYMYSFYFQLLIVVLYLSDAECGTQILRLTFERCRDFEVCVFSRCTISLYSNICVTYGVFGFFHCSHLQHTFLCQFFTQRFLQICFAGTLRHFYVKMINYNKQIGFLTFVHFDPRR